MPLNWPPAGPSDVPSYQMSAIPFVTSSNGAEVSTSAISVKFPNATRFIVVRETEGQDLRVGFTANGVLGKGGSVSGSIPPGVPSDHRNYFVVRANETTPRLEVRCKEIFFVRDGNTDCGFTLLAGLTPIRPTDFPILTGSSGFVGIG